MIADTPDKLLGYVVWHYLPPEIPRRDAAPLLLCRGPGMGRHGLLRLAGSLYTTFATEGAALAAIERTVDWGKAHDGEWGGEWVVSAKVERAGKVVCQSLPVVASPPRASSGVAPGRGRA